MVPVPVTAVEPAEPPIGAVSGRGSSLVLMRMSGRYAAEQVMRLDQ